MSMKNLLKGHNEKHVALGAEIEKLYSAQEMGIIVASLLLAKQVDSTALTLTPEQAAVNKPIRDKKRSDNKSRRFSDKKKSFSNDKRSYGNKKESYGNKKAGNHNKI